MQNKDDGSARKKREIQGGAVIKKGYACSN